ncbi:hypothetical protein P19250A_0056 [Methylophilaceae phage P19250A]|nr:hypothetical protein P19250A_0056 [Methylophilaceae phage P19250A]
MALIDTIFGAVSTVLDRVIPDKNAREKAKEELERAINDQDFQIALEQIKVNLAEAQSESFFKSGWRPSVGWICSIAFGLHFVILPLFNYFLMLCGGQPILVPFQMDTLLTVLLGLLGMGTLRTVEKMKLK